MEYVFVYGSLLSPRELRKKGIDPSRCRPAVLPGYRIVFDKDSKRRCAAANLERCQSEACEAIGVVCEADEKALNELDEREKGYDRWLATCRTIGGDEQEVKAYTYISGVRLGGDEIERCTHNNEFCEYLRIIADGLVHWEKLEEGFIKRYLNSMKSDEIHLKIAAMLECFAKSKLKTE